jgi:hypothetical protein
MLPFNETTSPPLIEITISRTVLRRCLVIVPLSLLFLLGVIGAAVSPLINGHPVILTRERLALKSYLVEAQNWIQRLDDIAARLDALSPVSIATANTVVTNIAVISITQIPTRSLPAQINLPAQAPLAAYTTPAKQPTNLFDRAQAAEQVIQQLQALERDLQQIETPAAFTRLQELSTETVQAFATWSSQVMDAIGTPTPDTIAAAQTSRQSALAALDSLRQALTQRQGIKP